MSIKRSKPVCQLAERNGNIFNLVSVASLALKKEGLNSEATEMRERAIHSGSYDKALAIVMEYVEVE